MKFRWTVPDICIWFSDIFKCISEDSSTIEVVHIDHILLQSLGAIITQRSINKLGFHVIKQPGALVPTPIFLVPSWNHFGSMYFGVSSHLLFSTTLDADGCWSLSWFLVPGGMSGSGASCAYYALFLWTKLNDGGSLMNG